MSDTEKEEDIFKTKPRVERSPTRPSRINESGFVSDFINVARNCEKIDSKNPSTEKKNTTQTVQGDSIGRKSVSFQIPTTSSTFYGANDNSNTDLLDLESDFQFNPNSSSAFPFGNSLLDPYVGAQDTFSNLANNSSIHLSETDLFNRSYKIFSLVFLAQTVCTNNNIDYSGAIAESSNWKHSFEARFNTNNSVETVNRNKITIDTFEEEEMANTLDVHSIVKGVDKFNSKNREEIESFIANVELYDDLCGDSNELKLIVLKTVKSRLKAITILGNVQSMTLEQIITRIREKFKLSMTFDAAQEKLLAIQ